MRAMLVIWAERLRDGFWAIPSAALIVAVLMGVLMPALDSYLLTEQAELMTYLTSQAWVRIFFFNAGPEGARATLSAIAGSSITVAATVFSITIATLALVSSQFGPRLLRAFTSDRGVQVAMAAFVMAFVYPVTVLRTVRAEADSIEQFVPHLSVTLALIVGLLAAGVLIYFVDHVSNMIRAPHVVDTVGEDLDAVLDDAIPADGSRGDSDEEVDALAGDAELPGADAPVALRAREAGYVRFVDVRGLVARARERNAVLRLEVGPGTYVYEGTPLVRRRRQDVLGDEDAEEMHRAIAVGARRTLAQDPVYGINQLVEIALRAMSPGINDPFTAMSCVDRLSAALARIADRPFPDPRRYDDDDHVRVVLRRPTFGYLVQIAYAPIRRYSTRDAAMLGRMADGLTRLLDHTDRPERLEALGEQVGAVARAGERLEDADDTDLVRRKCQAFRAVLDARLGDAAGKTSGGDSAPSVGGNGRRGQNHPPHDRPAAGLERARQER